MNARERVLNALECRGVDRLPVDYWTTFGHFSDFAGAGPRYEYDENRHEEGGYEVWYDIFGNKWGRLASDKLSKGEVLEGVLGDWAALDDLELPDLVALGDWTRVGETLDAARDRFLLCGMPGLGFSVMRKMRKMDRFLMDLAAEPECVERLHGRVMDILLRLVSKYAEYGVDGVMFGEDWGTQDRLLISPAMWRALFKPHFRTFCDHCHGLGIKVFMHSCGYLYEILDDLMEVGVDALQFDQQQNYGIDRLDEKVGGRAALFSPVDIQHTLVTGDRDKIRRECFELVETLGGHDGGFIAKSYGVRASLETIGCRMEWNDYAFQCFMEASAKVYGEALPIPAGIR